MSLTFEETIKVRLNGKHIGDIKQVVPGRANNGWYYQPKGSTQRGDIMITAEAVKKSLGSGT